jgi:hypothetical protein
MNEFDDLVLLQREMTAEIIVGDDTDHARLKVGNQPARQGESQACATGMSLYDEYALNLWVMAEVYGRERPQFEGVLSIEAHERVWQRLLREQRHELDAMLRLHPRARMGTHLRGSSE